MGRASIGRALAGNIFTMAWVTIGALGFSAEAGGFSADAGDVDWEARLAEVHRMAAQAQDTKSLSEIVATCEEMLAESPAAENARYLKETLGWALTRRGLARMELSGHLQDAGNGAEAERATAMAADDFDKAINVAPQRWRGYLCRGVMRGHEGDAERAIADFSRVIEISPDVTAAWFNRAELRSTAGDLNGALQDYQKVIEQSPGDLQALTGRGHTLYQLGHYREALADYEVVVKFRPTSAWALANRGDAYQALGEWASAYLDYVAAVKAEPLGAVYQRAAWMLATCPDERYFQPQVAMEMAERAIELDGETAENLEALAAACAAHGDFEKAKTSQAKAVALPGPDRPAREQRLKLYEASQPFQQSLPR